MLQKLYRVLFLWLFRLYEMCSQRSIDSVLCNEYHGDLLPGTIFTSETAFYSPSCNV